MVVNFRPQPLYSQGNIPQYPFDGRWVGLRASSDAVEKRKIFCPYQELNSGHPAHSPSLY
jgi:hypothetical protein